MIIFVVVVVIEAGLGVPGVAAARPGQRGQSGEGGVEVVERPGDDHVVVDAHVEVHEEHRPADALEDGRQAPD